MNHEGDTVGEGPVQQVVAKAERMRKFGGPRETGTVVAGHHHQRPRQFTGALERREKLAERLIEIVHAVEVVAEGRVTPFAHVQLLVAVRKRLEGIVQRQGDQPRRERRRCAREFRHHLQEEVTVVKAPPDPLARGEVGGKRRRLEPVAGMHDPAIPERRRERDGGQRAVAVQRQHLRHADQVIGCIDKRRRTMLFGQQ